jgi:hypothetical protein
MRVEFGCGTVLVVVVLVSTVLFLILVIAGQAISAVLGLGAS